MTKKEMDARDKGTVDGLDRLALEIIEAANVWVDVLDNETNVLLWNEAAERISGYTRKEVVGHKKIWQWLYPDPQYRAEIAKKVGSILAGNAVENLETTIVCKNGEQRIISWHSQAILDEHGRPSGSVALGRDVTRLHHLERHLRSAQKMEALGTLAEGIAHDFNNVVHVIGGYAQLAQRATVSKEKLDKYLSMIAKACKRAESLVEQIFSFAKHKEQPLKPIQLYGVVDEGMELLHNTLPANVKIRKRLDPECAPILGDPSRIEQILFNLCTNAFHAMGDQGGELEVTLQNVAVAETIIERMPGLKKGPHVKLTVSDTGCGIPPDAIERVFDPYFTTKSKENGSGLGLAIVHSIVKSHGGDIGVRSTPHQRTRFEVFFPALAENMDHRPAADRYSMPLGRGQLILCVDDQAHMLDVLVAMLRDLGYHAQATTSAQEALTIMSAERDSIHAAIIDFMMEEMSGLELTAAIKEIKSDLPVLLYTGYRHHINAEKAKKYGVQQFLTKPFAADQLAWALYETH